MDNLSQLAVQVASFAASNSLTLLPAAPERGAGPEVDFDPAKTDLATFLGFAAKLGGGILYLRSDPFDPSAYDDLGEHAAQLRRCKGKIGLIQAAFAVNGLVHHWQQRTEWYETFEDHQDSRRRRAWKMPRPGWASTAWRSPASPTGRTARWWTWSPLRSRHGGALSAAVGRGGRRCGGRPGLVTCPWRASQQVALVQAPVVP